MSNKFAVISSTADPKYSFFIPIVVWCWSKLGVDTYVYIPKRVWDTPLMRCVYIHTQSSAYFHTFSCTENQEATYAQCSRLYAACDADERDLLITSDVDMAVFHKFAHSGSWIDIYGSDLVPEGQYPMCYAVATGKTWKEVMRIHEGDTLQSCLDVQLKHEDMENMRGNLWSRDQELLYSHATKHRTPVSEIKRARPTTMFASRRVDRDDINWRAYVGDQLFDAHLWRPGYTEENFANIIELLKYQFPGSDHGWVPKYRDSFIKLLK